MKKEHLLIIALACGSLPSLAAMGSGSNQPTKNVTIDSLQWTLVDSTQTATLYRYDKKGDTAIIPETVEYGGKTYQVVAIANNSYYGVFYNTHDNIKHIKLPKSLKILGDQALYNCANLQEINLPESVDSIGEHAMYNCKSLKSLTIPAKVTGIGNYAFANNDSLTVLYVEAPIPPRFSGSSPFYYTNNILPIYVPEGSGSAYRNAKIWNDFIIAQGKGVTVNVELPYAGSLGDEILKQTEDLADVNNLKIKGSLNDNDIYNIQNRMPNLMEIDLSETDMKSLPANMFSGRKAITRIILPNHLESIGHNAFYYCTRLKNITIPASVTMLESNAFYGCTSLESIALPDGITSIPNGCFYAAKALEDVILPKKLIKIEDNAFNNCQNLKHLDFPESLTDIESYAFNNCANLENIELPNNLVNLKDAAFGYCNKLTKVTLPESVRYAYASFSGCRNLTQITCLAMQPPKGNNNNLFSSSDLTGKTLYVPSIAIENYKLTSGWDQFKDIQPLDYLPSQVYVTSNFTLNIPDDLADTYHPQVTISNWENSQGGHLTIKGNNTLSLSHFNTAYDDHYEWWSGENKENTHKGTLITETKVQADNVSIDLYVAKNLWEFISFPFDVKVSSIKCLTDDTQWVIRKYSGEARANGEAGSTWQTMKSDSILHAHEGYILQCTNSDYSSTPIHFLFPAIDNANKNNILASDNQKVGMKEYQSEFAHNRSWNLLGNPYPAFFDTRFFDYAAPFTVWNRSNQTYQAYSPIDDSYILRPSEAFFVQRPADQSEITFSKEGRQHDKTVRTIEDTTTEEMDVLKARTQTTDPAKREVFNLLLSGYDATDRTRLVINPQAEMGYHAAHDAGKMISETTRTAQLYTIGDNDGLEYAINERPLGNGMISLGAIFAEPGTYTLSLTDGKTAILIDKLEGKQVELDANGYTFSTKAGEIRDRFCIKVARGTTAIENMADINASEKTSSTSIYTLDGKKVKGMKHGVGSMKNADANLPAGTYIMQSGNKTRKVNTRTY